MENSMGFGVRRFALLIGLLSLGASVSQAAVLAEGPVDASPGPKRTTADLLFSLKEPRIDYVALVKALRAADVDADVKEAVRRKDRRLIGVVGYALVVPGVQDGSPHKVPAPFRAVAIEGTSDFLESDAQEQFQRLLTKYAERYNQGLLVAH
jgi:hypothetical protein